VVVLVHRDLARTEGRLKSWKWLLVDVETFRAAGRRGNDFHFTRGWARGHSHLMLRPPAPHRSSGGTYTSTFAFTVRHELLHAYGYNHGQFVDREPDNMAAIVAAVGERLPVRAVHAKAPPSGPAGRYARVLELERAWARKLKLAQTKLRQYRAKRRYYEGRQARAAGPSPPDDAEHTETTGLHATRTHTASAPQSGRSDPSLLPAAVGDGAL
jgi:hypothetical protein